MPVATPAPTTPGLASGYRGLLAIDVDGPLNPYGAKAWRRPEGYASYRLTQDGRWLTGSDFRQHKGMRVWLNPGHGELLLDLADRTGLRPVWATTWLDMANTCIAPAIGLPDLPVITFPSTDLSTAGNVGYWLAEGGWKYPSVAAAAAGVPLAWLDDDFDDGWRSSREAFELERAGTPTLLCTVNAATGLSAEHCDQIARWAATF